MQDVNEIKLLLDSRIPLVVIETFEEKKALDVLAMVANNQGRDLHRWSVTDGLTRINFGPQLVPKGSDLNQIEEALKHIKSQTQPGVYALCDIHPFLESQPQVVRQMIHPLRPGEKTRQQHHHAQRLTGRARHFVQLGARERDARDLGAVCLAAHHRLVRA